ncbi:hypothetical protein ABIA32_005050 [Streptacidiphilus sp. MAP12-20]|uniref:hypothetical protein n=1 Tax=Streptacidiphilus sp. MAP12-20 TaxID=3156299 RepID=UPI003513CFAF
MDLREKLFDWLLSLLFQNTGVETSLILVGLVLLLAPRERERRSPVGVILAIGMVMVFGGHLVLRITIPGRQA